MNSSISFPNIEFSYETITDRKIHSNYNICFAIPQAKKYVIWYTCYQNENICYLLELNRDKKISKICKTSKSSNKSLLHLGTIFYGSIISENDQFIIEDILSYHGISLRQMCFGEKLGIIKVFLEIPNPDSPVTFFLPKFWNSHINDLVTTPIPMKDINYQIHHVQFRSLTMIIPYLNVFLTNGDVPWKNDNNVLSSTPVSERVRTLVQNQCIETNINSKTIYHKNKHQQYKQIFTVIADSQNDIYHLFASENNSSVYYDVAYIPNCKSSIYMNSLFRNIKENIDLDFIEESDDEEDFENIQEDKYVDLDKMIGMECVYHTKFKRWVPIKVIHNYTQEQIVNIHDLPKI
jgi:hypothetical protein